MNLLEDQEIEVRLSHLDGWRREGETIVKTFDRGDFNGAVAFVSAVAPVADAMNHHPDVAISWKDVTLSLSTHSKGGLTSSDFELAARIDEVA